MTYYRADTRKNIRVASPVGLYPVSDSGGRPKNCKKEIAFADSIGGALYGAMQNLTSEDDRDVKPQDFLSTKKKFTLYVYSTDAEPTYEVQPSAMLDVLHEAPDYSVTNEVRYCDKDVPVKKVCSCDIQQRDIAIVGGLLYVDKDTEYFDWSKAMPEMCNKEEKRLGYWESQECYNAVEKLQLRVVAGDEKLIKKILLKKPMPMEENIDVFDAVTGIDTYIADELVRVLEKRCR
jgi:hypothetical protein